MPSGHAHFMSQIYIPTGCSEGPALKRHAQPLHTPPGQLAQMLLRGCKAQPRPSEQLGDRTVSHGDTPIAGRKSEMDSCWREGSVCKSQPTKQHNPSLVKLTLHPRSAQSMRHVLSWPADTPSAGMPTKALLPFSARIKIKRVCALVCISTPSTWSEGMHLQPWLLVRSPIPIMPNACVLLKSSWPCKILLNAASNWPCLTGTYAPSSGHRALLSQNI